MKFPVKYGYCPCSHDAFRRFVAETLDSYDEKNQNAKHLKALVMGTKVSDINKEIETLISIIEKIKGKLVPVKGSLEYFSSEILSQVVLFPKSR